MKIMIVEEIYNYDEDCKVYPLSDIVEVTQDEYERLKNSFTIRVLKDKDWFLEQADKDIAKREATWKAYQATLKAYQEAEAKRKAKYAETAEKRKLKQLEKLKKELGIEDSIK